MAKKNLNRILEEFYERIKREQGIEIDRTKTESFSATREDLLKTGLFVFEDEKMYSERIKKDQEENNDDNTEN